MVFNFQQHVRFMGRFDQTDPAKPECGWVNSAVFLRFKGSEIRMTVEDSTGTDYVEIILDGIARNWIQLQKGTHEYVLQQGLDEQEIHTLEIHKRTEILYGRFKYLDFSLPNGGEFFSPPEVKKLKLEYHGDSITNGCGNLHPHEVTDAPHLDDGFMSYVGISARLLNAEYHTLAISGIGVLQDAMGNINGLPAHFHATLGQGTVAWDFSKYQADGVIINLGQNDYSTPIDDEKYISTYIDYVETILSQYPDAYVFCCVGTMNNNYLASVQKVVSYFNEQGNDKVFCVDLGLIHPEVEGWGGGFHPSVQTHYRMGTELAQFISTKTGWPLLERPVTPTVY
ncbi:SGNH/GDSL hydrolase family protein [Bacillus sp. SD088]|uniref:SGNH/GDSL hydrolase family protein n=1 Tax=Bacillus sp. SD088 TaxID=2782012 RepID=UPI001A97077A|nr:SGNH/GDSL hydrolase family protein [Bacillus sp. SD088]MBO0995789.1 acetyl xylan esterase [Bacillus sp. SD088]